jgi:hypothetical protein
VQLIRARTKVELDLRDADETITAGRTREVPLCPFAESVRV